MLQQAIADWKIRYFMPETVQDLPALDIPVNSARLTLMWPLAISLPRPADRGGAIEQAVQQSAERIRATLDATWAPVDDLAHHIAPPDKTQKLAFSQWQNEVYAEGVYFHPFVQEFLFSNDKTSSSGAPPIHLFRRDDIAAMRVEWAQGEETRKATLIVDRVLLYLFRTGVALLVTDLRAERTAGLTLADVEDLHDLLRRAYHPFVTHKSIKSEAPVRQASHLVVQTIAWRRKDAGVLGPYDLTSDFDDVIAYADGATRDARHPPVFAHWKDLLGGALTLAGGSAHEGGPVWRHVVDERMPALLTVSLSDRDEGLRPGGWLGAVRRGDLARLCFADNCNSYGRTTRGKGDFPCNPAFLGDFENRHAYDRFANSGTRYFVSGYSFVALGAGDGFDRFVAMHMRRHYYQMALLAHMEMATLLLVSREISDAAECYERAAGDDAAGDRFAAHMQAINEQFLQFVHRFRFTGVSNQLQASELYDLLRRQMNLQRLFDDVGKEIESANQFLFNRAQAKATQAATNLSRVAAVGVVAALAVGVLGMNFLAVHDLYSFLPGLLVAPGKEGKVLSLAGHLFMALAGGGGVTLGGWFVMRRLLRGDADSKASGILHSLWLTSIVMLLIAGMLLLMALSPTQ